jgi:HAD superfamily hydrolase (TIGR01509 family)
VEARRPPNSDRPLLAAILDVDGTLIDSNAAHAAAFVDAARELGISAPGVPAVLRLIGMGGDKLIPRAFGIAAESPEGARLEESKGEIFRARYLPQLRPTRGARRLLERFASDGLRLVVATSANREDLGHLLDRAGVADLIHDSTSASEAGESKPDPDIVRAALERTGAPIGRVVMLGDTPYDVEAAGRAGVRIVALRCGGWSDPDLVGAVAVYEDPQDVLAHYETSPFGRFAASPPQADGS